MKAQTYFWPLARLAFSGAASLSLVAHLGPRRHAIVLCVLFLGIVYAMAGPLAAWVRDAVARESRRGVALTLAVLWLVGFGLTYALPVPPAPAGRSGEPVELEITALGASPRGGQHEEVWFAIEADGARVPVEEIRHDGAWQPGDGMLHATKGGGAPARWSGRGSSVQLVLVSHPWSGRVRVAFNGEQREIDLYREAPGSNTFHSIRLTGDANPHLWMQYPDRTPLQRLVQLSDAALIAFALYCLFLWRSMAPVPLARTDAPLWKQSVRYALPSWSVSLCLLLAFWPGVMSNDSIAQWGWAHTGIASDWHPVYHTLFLTVARKIWDTPAFAVLLQAAALGLSSGFLVAVMERATRSSVAASHVAAWSCALMPIIAFSSVTLWKDIPYAASVVFITAGTIGLLFLGRPRLSHPLAFAAALVILLVCILFRHNGPPVAAAVLVTLFVLSRANRRTIAVLAVAALGIAVVLKGPVVDAMGVQRSNVSFSLFAHHIAAHLEAGEKPAATGTSTVLRDIAKGRETWPYSCGLVDTTVFNPAFDREAAARHNVLLRDTWLQMAMDHPETELRHMACVSSLVWLVDESGQRPLYEAGASIRTVDGQLTWVAKGSDVHERSVAPGTAARLGEWLEEARQFNLFWRPAAWLYLLIFAAWVATRRMGDWRIALVCLPVLVHSAVLAAANVAQDARYQLPVFIVALAAVPALLGSTARTRASSDP